MWNNYVRVYLSTYPLVQTNLLCVRTRKKYSFCSLFFPFYQCTESLSLPQTLSFPNELWMSPGCPDLLTQRPLVLNSWSELGLHAEETSENDIKNIGKRAWFDYLFVLQFAVWISLVFHIINMHSNKDVTRIFFLNVMVWIYDLKSLRTNLAQYLI